MNATLAVLGLSGGELVLVLVVILVLFGARKIPEFAKGLGKGLTEFKKASREVTDEIERAVDEPRPPPPPKAPPTNSKAETTAQPSAVQIGRASCRERWWTVEVAGRVERK